MARKSSFDKLCEGYFSHLVLCKVSFFINYGDKVSCSNVDNDFTECLGACPDITFLTSVVRKRWNPYFQEYSYYRTFYLSGSAHLMCSLLCLPQIYKRWNTIKISAL